MPAREAGAPGVEAVERRRDGPRGRSVVAAVAAGGMALGTTLALAVTEHVTGLAVFALPFVATAAVAAMAPAAPLSRPRAIVLGYGVAAVVGLATTSVVGPSSYTAAAVAAVSTAVLLLLKAPHAPAVAAVAVIGLRGPGVGYLLDPLLPAVALVISAALLAGRLLPGYHYPASWR